MPTRPSVRRARRVTLFVAAVLVVLATGGFTLHRLDIADRPQRAQRLALAMGVHPGSTVAELGAGDGAMAIEMARIVGPAGRIVATEVTEQQREGIRAAALRGGVTNLSVLPAREHDSGLPGGCCDAVYMQRVYHHLTDPAAVIASVRRALRPGGRVAVLEFEPGWIANFSTPSGVPDRGGHGVPKQMLLREMKEYGFGPVGELTDFGGEVYLGVFVR